MYHNRDKINAVINIQMKMLRKKNPHTNIHMVALSRVDLKVFRRSFKAQPKPCFCHLGTHCEKNKRNNHEIQFNLTTRLKEYFFWFKVHNKIYMFNKTSCFQKKNVDIFSFSSQTQQITFKYLIQFVFVSRTSEFDLSFRVCYENSDETKIVLINLSLYNVIIVRYYVLFSDNITSIYT